LGTGLKRRFVISIGLAIATAMIAVSLFQSYFFRAEQSRLIDSRIQSTASLLISSDLSSEELADFEEAESIIEEVIGGESYNQFVVISDREGKEFYRSLSAISMLPDRFSTESKWQTIEYEGHVLRVLTLPLGGRVLQTGLALDLELVRLRNININILFISFFFLLLLLSLTVILTRILLRPLEDLGKFLRYVNLNFKNPVSVSDAPIEYLPSDSMSTNDEIGRLVTEVNQLNRNAVTSLGRTQRWTAQLTHEMKTPLTILLTQIQKLELSLTMPEQASTLAEAKSEIYRINSLVSDFLEWSQTENLPRGGDELHAIRVRRTVEQIVLRLQQGLPEPDRSRIVFSADPLVNERATVFAYPAFVEQAIGNLISNALKYSPEQSIVSVILKVNGISVEDEGVGLPEAVLRNLGQPFNSGKMSGEGFGLGLAWIDTICRRYGWRLEIARTDKSKTSVGIIWNADFQA
jgi:signal transduction histidine kinase